MVKFNYNYFIFITLLLINIVKSQLNETSVLIDNPEYDNFVNALSQTEDLCMENAYVVSLNLIHANVGECENKYSNKLEDFKKTRPCEDVAKDFQNAIDYMTNNVNILCNSEDTDNFTIDGIRIKKPCWYTEYIRTNRTLFETELYSECKKVNQTQCTSTLLQNYLEMEQIVKKLNKEKVTYQLENETVTIRMDMSENDFDVLSDRCLVYKNLKVEINGAIRNTFSIITFATLFLFFKIFC